MHTPKVKASRGSIASEHLGKGVVFVEMEPGSNREPRVSEEDAGRSIHSNKTKLPFSSTKIVSNFQLGLSAFITTAT